MKKTMEQQIIKLLNQRMVELYEAVKNILLTQASYTCRVNTENLSVYFCFLETALHRPYNRLRSMAAFIRGTNDLLTEEMYPFCFLREESKQMIEDKFLQASRYISGLDFNGIELDIISLCKERHNLG